MAAGDGGHRVALLSKADITREINTRFPVVLVTVPTARRSHFLGAHSSFTEDGISRLVSILPVAKPDMHFQEEKHRQALFVALQLTIPVEANSNKPDLAKQPCHGIAVFQKQDISLSSLGLSMP